MKGSGRLGRLGQFPRTSQTDGERIWWSNERQNWPSEGHMEMMRGSSEECSDGRCLRLQFVKLGEFSRGFAAAVHGAIARSCERRITF